MLFNQLLHAEHLAVVVQIVEHVCVLVAPQPFVFPVEAEGFGLLEHLADLVFVFETTAVGILALIREPVQIVDWLGLQRLENEWPVCVDVNRLLLELLLALSLVLIANIADVC